MKNLSVRDMCYIAVFTAIIAIVSQISVPMPAGVPMTMQTFIIPLAAVILGTRNGTIASVIYVLLGMFGAPVFAGFKGGLDTVFGMTGGFIVSFPILAFVAGIGYQLAVKAGKGFRFYSVLTLAMLLGAICNYAFGTVWFSVVSGQTMLASFIACVAPFIVTSLLKIVMVVILGPMLRKTMMRSGVLMTSRN